MGSFGGESGPRSAERARVPLAAAPPCGGAQRSGHSCSRGCQSSMPRGETKGNSSLRSALLPETRGTLRAGPAA